MKTRRHLDDKSTVERVFDQRIILDFLLSFIRAFLVLICCFFQKWIKIILGGASISWQESGTTINLGTRRLCFFLSFIFFANLFIAFVFLFFFVHFFFITILFLHGRNLSFSQIIMLSRSSYVYLNFFIIHFFSLGFTFISKLIRGLSYNNFSFFIKTILGFEKEIMK